MRENASSSGAFIISRSQTGWPINCRWVAFMKASAAEFSSTIRLLPSTRIKGAGNAAIKEATGCRITGPEAEKERIPTLDVMVKEGDTVQLGDVVAEVIDVPAHTAGHIAFHIPSEKDAFVGDTLFAMGSGRLFDGTAEQMYDNMRKLEALPEATKIYCAHEYTQANGEYALVAEPDNLALKERMAEVLTLRERGEATVPTTIKQERATNPFMRAKSAAELAERRIAKDNF